MVCLPVFTLSASPDADNIMIPPTIIIIVQINETISVSMETTPFNAVINEGSNDAATEIKGNDNKLTKNKDTIIF